ncbi:MAG: hypothetical protein RLZ13_316 [Bacteroidota bacterium]|jgi:hypothetical protein
MYQVGYEARTETQEPRLGSQPAVGRQKARLGRLPGVGRPADVRNKLPPLLHSSIGVMRSTLKEYQVTSILSADMQASQYTKYLQNCQLSQHMNPHFFLQHLAFGVRH